MDAGCSWWRGFEWTINTNIHRDSTRHAVRHKNWHFMWFMTIWHNVHGSLRPGGERGRNWKLKKVFHRRLLMLELFDNDPSQECVMTNKMVRLQVKRANPHWRLHSANANFWSDVLTFFWCSGSGSIWFDQWSVGMRTVQISLSSCMCACVYRHGGGWRGDHRSCAELQPLWEWWMLWCQGQHRLLLWRRPDPGAGQSLLHQRHRSGAAARHLHTHTF